MKDIHHILATKTKRSPVGCWTWIGWRDKNGYGITSLRIHGKQERRAHRIVWFLNFGTIPTGFCVCHKCDNPSCVNPEHLFLGTNQDNMTDKAKKQRCNPPAGERSGLAKLSEEDVLKIRALHEAGVVQRRIAEQFGVGFKAINKIVLRQRWAHV